MKCPENIKITDGHCTYRGGDELPERVAEKLGLNIPTTETTTEKIKPKKKDIKNGD